MIIIESGTLGKPCCNFMLNTTSLFHFDSLQKLYTRSLTDQGRKLEFCISVSFERLNESKKCSGTFSE